MDPFTFGPCPRILFGRGRFTESGAAARTLGGRAMIVSDPFCSQNGLAARLQASLTQAGMGSVLFDQVVPNPTSTSIDQVTELARAAAGARYHSVIIEGFGWCNASDALTAIRRLVFAERRCSLEDLVLAARSDYRDDPALRAALLACPKFGNGDLEADDIAARVTAGFATMVSRHSSGNIAFLPSYHTLNAHIGAGKITAASLDGRRVGEPLGKNIGPMPGANRCGPTGVILSASHLDQGALGGGQALDLSVDPQLVAQPAWRAAFRALLLTYFQRGGLQIQVNGVTAATLRAAMAAPAEHRDLAVRIGGYSVRFNCLGRENQREVIQRTEQGL